MFTQPRYCLHTLFTRGLPAISHQCLWYLRCVCSREVTLVAAGERIGRGLFSGLLATCWLLWTSVVVAEPVRVGLSLPLTGPAATYGVDIRNVLQFLNERAGAEGFQFELEDDRCDPKEAAKIAQKFIRSRGVAAVLGVPCSGTALAAAPIYERAKVLTISIGAGAPALSAAGDYIFRTRPSDIHSAAVLAAKIAEQHRHIAIIAEQTELAQGIADAVSEQVKKSGVRVSREDFLTDSADVRSQLLRLKSQSPEAYLLLTQAESGLVVLTRAAKEMKLEGPLYSSIFPGSPTFLRAVGTSANGMRFSTLPDRRSFSEHAQVLLTEFETRFGPLVSVDYAFSITYDAFVAIQAALKTSDAKSALYSQKVTGATGAIGFDEQGDIVGPRYQLYCIIDQRVDDC